jgi:hypothetical protein
VTRRLSAAVIVVAAAALAGCSSTVALDPADGANDPLCAEVIVRLPGEVDGEQRRWTDAQATGAWGEPTSVILTCGVDPIGATTLPCTTSAGVDWVVDDSEAPRYRATTFGRTPAVEVYIDSEAVPPAGALEPLSRIVGATLPSDGSTCSEPSDG